ncbi:MAG TPA: hypothetical protein VEL05_03900 [Candidatus Acidoferrum sp.]|nr:hypothetical protein [Candidatus Acidoferrum sp.]
MTAANDDSGRLAVSRSMILAPLALVGAGGAALAWGLFASPERTWLNLLVDAFYFMSLGVSAIFFFATQRLTSARWSVALRRIPEAFMLTLPVAAVLMTALLVFGREAIYPWTAPDAFAHDPAIAGKATYLRPDFVVARMAAVLAIWIAFAWRIRRVSLAQESDPQHRFNDPGRSLLAHARLDRSAAAFAPIFALTFTAAAYDWIISLEPDWFSTMFAVYVFAGTFVQGIAAITLATVLLARRGLLGDRVGAQQFHDLGKMLFAFSTFWAYIWVCQYLLIWYGDLPEEVTYYIRRTSGGWLPLFLGSLAVNWIVPFFALLSVRAKRSPRVLAAVSVLFLLGHWLDLYIMVMPSKWTAPRFGLIELGLALGCAALFCLASLRGLARAPLVPTNDPVLTSTGGPSRGVEP